MKFSNNFETIFFYLTNFSRSGMLELGNHCFQLNIIMIKEFPGEFIPAGGFWDSSLRVWRV